MRKVTGEQIVKDWQYFRVQGWIGSTTSNFRLEESEAEGYGRVIMILLWSGDEIGIWREYFYDRGELENHWERLRELAHEKSESAPFPSRIAARKARELLSALARAQEQRWWEGVSDVHGRR